jgi:hypothetical protein
MKDCRILSAALVFFSGLGSSQAQFPEIAQHPGAVHQISSLSSGTRLIEHFTTNITTSGTRTIYNLDLTVHRVLVYPAPPAGMGWANMGYITEELFDTDPSTIEFTLTAGSISGPGNVASFVFREDGTELFQQNPGALVSGITGHQTGFSPIFMEGGQAYMVVFTTGMFGPPTRVYALPGTLPCMDCHGSPTTSGIILGEPDGIAPFPGLLLQPNPAQDALHVQLNGWAEQAQEILLLDAGGREVMRKRVTNSIAEELGIGHLPNGRYTVAATRNGFRVATAPLVIAR